MPREPESLPSRRLMLGAGAATFGWGMAPATAAGTGHAYSGMTMHTHGPTRRALVGAAGAVAAHGRPQAIALTAQVPGPLK